MNASSCFDADSWFCARPFITLFSRHMLLMGEVALMGAILVFRLGWELGVPGLFWQAERRKQLVAGLALAGFFGEVLLVGYLRDVGDLPEGQRGATSYFVSGELVLGLLTILATLGMRLARRRRKGRAPVNRAAALERDVPSWPLLAGLGGGTFLIDIALVATEGAPIGTYHVLAAIIVGVLIGFHALNTWLNKRGEWATPAVGLCVLLSLLAAIHGWEAFHLLNASVELIILGVLLVVGGWPTYKFRVKALTAFYAPGKEARMADYPKQPRGESVGFEIAWTKAGRKRPLVIVCASGGGIRAAVWTAAVLTRLDTSIDGFPHHVRIITGASGGMLGGAFYAATVTENGEQGWYHALPRAEMLRRVGSDGLQALAQRLVNHDIPLALLPWSSSRHRAQYLEDAWREDLGPGFQQTFGELLPGEQQGWRPSLILSPMLVEDGRRLLFSNLDLDFLIRNKGPAVTGAPADADGSRVLSQGAFEFDRLFSKQLAEFPISTAVRLNAAFPFASPAEALPLIPRRRVGDAGYFDDFGVDVGGRWLDDVFHDERKRRWLEANVSGIAVVQIRDSPTGISDPQPGREVPPPNPLARGIEEITGPISAIFSARDPAMILRGDERLQSLSRRFATDFGPTFFATSLFEFAGQAPLNWHLTPAEFADLVGQSESAETSETIRALSEWWVGR